MQSVAKSTLKKDILLKYAAKIKQNKYPKEKIYAPDGSKVFEGRNTTIATVKTRIEYFDNLFQTYLEQI